MATEFLIYAELQSLTFQYIFDICDSQSISKDIFTQDFN